MLQCYHQRHSLAGDHGNSGRIVTSETGGLFEARAQPHQDAECTKPTPKTTVLKWGWNPREMSMQASRPLIVLASTRAQAQRGALTHQLICPALLHSPSRTTRRSTSHAASWFWMSNLAGNRKMAWSLLNGTACHMGLSVSRHICRGDRRCITGFSSLQHVQVC